MRFSVPRGRRFRHRASGLRRAGRSGAPGLRTGAGRLSVRALVVQHEEDAPGGLVSAWLGERGAEQDVYMVTADGRGPDPREYDLVVSLGSEESAYDDGLPWVPREVALLREAADGDVPVLGICFGSQILARALGGQALRARSLGDRLGADSQPGSGRWSERDPGFSGTTTRSRRRPAPRCWPRARPVRRPTSSGAAWASSSTRR